jgi:hypothetical protein
LDSLAWQVGANTGSNNNVKTVSKTVVAANAAGVCANIQCATQCCATANKGDPCGCSGGAGAAVGSQSIERIVADAIGEKKEIEKMVDHYKEVMKGGEIDRQIANAK